ncbi:hypothetical protein BH10ACI2_BH10ACI2_21300 [soil metagenome]
MHNPSHRANRWKLINLISNRPGESFLLSELCVMILGCFVINKGG